MEIVCQACGYQRKPTDDAPDWECPSCGKAYAKTADESPGPLVVYPDNEGPGDHGSPNTSILLFSLLGSGVISFLVMLVDESSPHQGPLIAVELLMPWIAVAAAYVYRKSLLPELGEFSSVILCFNLCVLMIGVGMLASDHSLVFDPGKVWPKGILLAIPFGLACAAVVMCFDKHKTQRPPLLVWSLVIGAACVYGGALAALGNRWLDHSSSTVYSVSVIGKFVGSLGRGGSNHYYAVRLAPWGPVPKGYDLVVYPSDYRAMEPGRSVVCMAAHSGAFGMAWGAQVSCAGQTPTTN